MVAFDGQKNRALCIIFPSPIQNLMAETRALVLLLVSFSLLARNRLWVWVYIVTNGGDKRIQRYRPWSCSVVECTVVQTIDTTHYFSSEKKK